MKKVSLKEIIIKLDEIYKSKDYVLLKKECTNFLKLLFASKQVWRFCQILVAFSEYVYHRFLSDFISCCIHCRYDGPVNSGTHGFEFITKALHTYSYVPIIRTGPIICTG